jgi:hypothetical protein
MEDNPRVVAQSLKAEEVVEKFSLTDISHMTLPGYDAGPC